MRSPWTWLKPGLNSGHDWLIMFQIARQRLRFQGFVRWGVERGREKENERQKGRGGERERERGKEREGERERGVSAGIPRVPPVLEPPVRRERLLYWQPAGPNPLNRRDDFGRPALRYGSLKSFFLGSLTSTFLPRTNNY